MEKKINIQITSIREGLFTILFEKLPLTKEECKTNIDTLLGVNFSVDKSESLLHTTFWTILQLKGEPRPSDNPIVSFRLYYTVHIESIQLYCGGQKGDNVDIKLPNSLLKTIIEDVYATARALLSIKLANTVLSDYYMSFGGGTELFNNMMLENTIIPDK